MVIGALGLTMSIHNAEGVCSSQSTVIKSIDKTPHIMSLVNTHNKMIVNSGTPRYCSHATDKACRGGAIATNILAQ